MLKDGTEQDVLDFIVGEGPLFFEYLKIVLVSSKAFGIIIFSYVQILMVSVILSLFMRRVYAFSFFFLSQ